MTRGIQRGRPRFHIPGTVGRAILSVFLGCSFLSTGCQSLPHLDVEAEINNARASDASDPKASEPVTSEPPQRAPRTVPEALRAYLKKLRSPLPAAEKSKNGNGAEEGKKKEEEVPKGPKSPPAAGTPETPADKAEKAESKNGEKATDSETGKDKENGKDEKEKKEETHDTWYSAHAQATMVTQVHDHFPALYTGTNSLLPVEPSATSLTATLFLDARLWEDDGNSGELVFNPELSGGRGFSGVLGVAGFPNGEITRVGAIEPTPYFARLYYRQTWGLGGEKEKVEDGPNQVAGSRDVNRLTVSVGKMSSSDLVDDNVYSHDPRIQFLNWSLMFNGAWDYPANVRGYTYGVAFDYNTKYWAFRYGIFAEPTLPNGTALDPHIDDANGQVIELEERYCLDDHPGKLRLLAYLNHAHMGKYREALAEMPIDPQIDQTSAYRFKYGLGANLEQELTKDLGLFVRVGWNDGQTETWSFTEIDQTAAAGFLLKGRCWRRPQDQVGLAVVANGLSDAHRDYLAAGGLGFIIGDGRLNYGLEEILETYYNYEVIKGMNLTAGFQEVNHPAYNRDRGPVSIGTLRVHIEF